MIETAIEVTDEQVSGSVIAELIDAGREMLAHPIDLLPPARETIETLPENHRILLITKGDLLDQERKLAQSGLGGLFDRVEIVSAKDRSTYHRIFTDHADDPEHGMVVGNSMALDVGPMIDAGGWGVLSRKRFLGPLNMPKNRITRALPNSKP